MRALLILLATTSFVAYAWAIHALFSRPDGLQPGMRLIARCGTLFAIVHVGWLSVAPAAPSGWQASATAIYVFALLLFAWAVRTTWHVKLPIAFSHTTPDDLVATGPYALLRHPFYTAYTLTWIAGAVAAASFVLLSTALWMFFLYTRAAALEDEQLLKGPHGEAYRAYTQKGSSV